MTRLPRLNIKGMPLLLAAGLAVLAIGLVTLRAQVATARPDVDLLYPGSTIISRVDTSTATRQMLSSNASSEEILAFYRSDLEGRGFGFAGGANVPTTTEDFACAWQRDGYVLRLAFMDLEALDPAFVAEHVTGSTTLYRWSVIEGDVLTADRPCNILLPGDPVPQ